MENEKTSVPVASSLTTAPLRHRLRIELHAPIPDVWALVGQHTRLPEYSAGISSVELERGADGPPLRICQFRSPDGSAGLRLRERIRWEVPNVGHATTAEAGNPFGLENALEIVTVAATATGTLVSWEEYYDNPDLETARASYDEGLGDIARRLVERFGGRVLERFTDAPL